MDELNKSTDLGISIIICCYNSAKRLPKTLKHIADQKTEPKLNWELIIVNNASKDNTVTVANECLKSTFNIKYKVLDVLKPGKSYAILKGVEESKYEFLLFCDDDNWLSSDYVQLSYNIMANNLAIGVLGNQSIGEYEVTPPEWFLKNTPSFAIGKQGVTSGDITFKKGSLWGAGFIVRRPIFEKLQSCGFEFIFLGRIGDSLTGGEDRELCSAAKILGYRIYYDEKLMIKHFMAKNRFNFDNFLKQTYLNGKASFINDVYNLKVRSYIYYLIKNVFTALIKLSIVCILHGFFKLVGISSYLNYKNKPRIYYFLGRLNILLNFSYNKECLNNVKNNILKLNSITK